MHPKRTDGQPIHVMTMPDGRVFVDVPRTPVSRGGPDCPRHFCRFEDYGLEGGLQRCWKCGAVQDDPTRRLPGDMVW